MTLKWRRFQVSDKFSSNDETGKYGITSTETSIAVRDSRVRYDATMRSKLFEWQVGTWIVLNDRNIYILKSERKNQNTKTPIWQPDPRNRVFINISQPRVCIWGLCEIGYYTPHVRSCYWCRWDVEISTAWGAAWVRWSTWTRWMDKRCQLHGDLIYWPFRWLLRLSPAVVPKHWWTVSERCIYQSLLTCGMTLHQENQIWLMANSLSQAISTCLSLCNNMSESARIRYHRVLLSLGPWIIYYLVREGVQIIIVMYIVNMGRKKLNTMWL